MNDNGIGKNLRRARILKNLSLKEAGIILNMTAPGVAKYEKGEIIPDSQKLIEFAHAYNVKSMDLLKSYEVPQMKFNSFRKKKRLTGKNLEILKELIQNEVAKYLEVINLNNFINCKIKLKLYECKTLLDAEEAANKFRKEIINISKIQPLSDLTNLLENLGFVIITIKNYNNMFKDFDGLSEIVDGIPFIVLLDDINDGARQRFTIAHELGHLLLNVKKDLEIDEEKLCHRFASALLMPKEAVENEFGTNRNKISFYELEAFKLEYKVSFTAIAYRLKDLNIINEYSYRNICIQLNKYNLTKNDPNPILPEKSFYLKKIVWQLQTNEIISLQKAYELLGETNDDYNIKDNNYGY